MADMEPLAEKGLPSWTYHDARYFAQEMERVIRPSWQIICHANDIPKPGDWHKLNILNESIIAIRGNDGQIRAFANVCRHRGMQLLDGAAGCAKKLVCSYHAWVYELDGKLSGVPMKSDYPEFDLADNGLFPMKCEVWQGFIFIRLNDDGGPSVAEMMAPADAEIAPYRLDEMQPLSSPSSRSRAVNWKNVGDNYSDNLHIPVAHDGLSRLFGKSYSISAHGWVDRMSGDLVDRPSANFWERFYQAHLPPVDHLPAANQRRWLYWKLWPNLAFDLYADQIDFMHWVPTGPETCDLRVMTYALPDTRREMKLVRYANDRINRVVNAEDTWLIEHVQAGMRSQFFDAGPLATTEVCLRSFNAKIRRLMGDILAKGPQA